MRPRCATRRQPGDPVSLQAPSCVGIHVGFSLTNIALALEGLGRHAEAVVAARRALAIGEASLGPEHPSIAGTLDNIGNMLAADGHHAEALAGAGTDPVRARELAQQARDGYTTDVGTLALRQEIDAWLAARATR